jgi:hypothetical protein
LRVARYLLGVVVAANMALTRGVRMALMMTMSFTFFGNAMTSVETAIASSHQGSSPASPSW